MENWNFNTVSVNHRCDKANAHFEWVMGENEETSQEVRCGNCGVVLYVQWGIKRKEEN